MTIRDFIAHHCPHLTHEQEIVCGAMDGQRRLVGVAKTLGGDMCPLVSFSRIGLSVVDSAGDYQIIDSSSILLF